MKEQHVEDYLAFSIASIGAKAQHISMKTKMVKQCGVAFTQFINPCNKGLQNL